MKKLFFTLGSLLFVSIVLGQILTGTVVDYLTADSKTYIFERNQFVMRIANRNNNKQDSCFYYKDGRKAPGTWDDYAMAELSDGGVMRSLNETFTPAEIASIKSSQTDMTITCIFNDKGRVVECSFILPMTPVAQSLPKERFATLEQKMKRYVTTAITDENTMKLKYVFGATQVSLWKQ